MVSSALDSAVGIGAGLRRRRAACRTCHYACGLGTGGLFVDDVAPPRAIEAGALASTLVNPDPDLLRTLAAPPDRRDWWFDRLRRCHPGRIGGSPSLV